MSDPFASEPDMIDIDLEAPNPSLEAGVDIWQVDEAKSDKSKRSGDPMIVLKLSRVRRSSDKIVDRIMLAGGGYDMGKQKLAAFLAPGYKGKLNLADLRNVRVYANTVVTSFEGRSKLEVKPANGLPNAGYLQWSEGGPVPPGYTAPSVDETPF